MIAAEQIKYMSMAITEARKGHGFTLSNPLVGAVIVKEQKVLAKAYHAVYGGDHAEAAAIKKLNPEQLQGADLYVTLEPCCHTGKTPPCTEAIIRAGIKRVIFANHDPDPRVKGKSIVCLKKAGIEVISGLLSREARQLNQIYFFARENNRPYIVLKAALTLDGKIATHSRDSKWISNAESRQKVQQLRSALQAIAVGSNTVIQDKPRLNCRLPGYENKPLDKLIFSSDPSRHTRPAFAANPGRIFIITPQICRTRQTFIDFCNQNQIQSILVEGGGQLYTWFINQQLADRIILFYKPAFLGQDGLPLFTRNGIDKISQLEEFNLYHIQSIKNNILLEMVRGDQAFPLLARDE